MAAGRLVRIPPRKKKVAYRKKKRAYRKRNYIARPLYVSKVGGIPDRLRTKLVWQGHAYGAINSATVSKDQMRLNSLYDPDYLNTLGNDQAQGRDRLADIYSNYYVRNVTMIMDIAAGGYSAQSSGTTLTVPNTALVVRTYAWNGTATFPTNIEGLPGCTSHLIATYNSKRIKRRFNLMQLQGSTSGNPLKNKDFGGVSGDSTTPEQITWLGIEYEAPGGASGIAITYVYTVTLIFDVEYCNTKYAVLDTN